MLSLGLCNFWPTFDKKQLPVLKFIENKYNVSYSQANPDLLIYNDHDNPPKQSNYNCIKILISGENLHLLDPAYRQGADYILSVNSDIPNSIYVPYPALFSDATWLKQKLDNVDKIKKYSKFACYVTTNSGSTSDSFIAAAGGFSGCMLRDQLYHQLQLEANKHGLVVDSAGKHLNNTGYLAPGGLDKDNGIHIDIEWLSQYKFNVCGENSYAPGYFTEKIYQCFAAGVIPIYLTHIDNLRYINPLSGIYGTCIDDIPKMVDRAINMSDEEREQMLKRKPFLIDLVSYQQSIFNKIDNIINNILNNKNGNIPIYCVNLDRSPDRWDRVCSRAEQVGCTLKRVPAIDRNNYLVDYYRGNYWLKHRNYKHMLSIVGCFASHLKAIQTGLEQMKAGDNGFIICEDDVLFNKNFKILLTQALAQRPKDAHCLIFSYIIDRWDNAKWCNKDQTTGFFTINCHDFHGMQMYWMDKNYAIYVLNKYNMPMDKINYHLPADTTSETLVRYSYNNNGCLFYPPLALEEADLSTISDESANYRRNVFEQFNYLNYTDGEKYAPKGSIFAIKTLETRLTKHIGPKCGVAEIDDVNFEQIGNYHSMNWILIKTITGDPHLQKDDKYYGLVRYINNIVSWHNSNNTVIQDGTDKLSSKLVLFAIDYNFKARLIGEIKDITTLPKYATRYLGWEDCRAFPDRCDPGYCWISGTNSELAIDGFPQIAIGKIDFTNLTINQAYAINRRPGFNQEKNWLPLQVNNNSFKLLWGFSPFTFVDIDNTIVTSTFSEVKQHFDFTGFKGSCIPIAFEGGWLAMTHTTRLEDKKYWYRHQLVWMNRDYVIEKASVSFYFEWDKLEFCLGWIVEDNTLLITTSSADFYPKIVKLKLDQIHAMLHQL